MACLTHALLLVYTIFCQGIWDGDYGRYVIQPALAIISMQLFQMCICLSAAIQRRGHNVAM